MVMVVMVVVVVVVVVPAVSLLAPTCRWRPAVHSRLRQHCSLWPPRSRCGLTKQCAQAMPSNGAFLRTWALCLLLCRLPPHATAGATNETACPARTVNYITHTLPQQCARGAHTAIQGAVDSPISSVVALVASHAQQTGSAASTPGAELETDSPFDNANFLSFEEWKKKNLEQAGQSPENVGQGRAAPSGQPARRRPVNVNALDSLGDEGEIEIDFSGFGRPAGKDSTASHVQPGVHDSGATKTAAAAADDGKSAPTSWALSKDAGKTCKERFNYASFDCAATVLKTNKQAKSSTSILVENKDSYMLNECSADNKFLIVELCDDILVDTIVLANYEFFSSMFRHFRVSVSDRYPVKMERWRTLGTFEARNSRDIQPFLITEPQIWARYLRIEFLTQFGNEFYCPLSLLRVHGTTMMEQFRREEEEARGIEDDDGDLETEVRDVLKPAEDSGPLPPDQIPLQVAKIEDDVPPREPTTTWDAAAAEITPGYVSIVSQLERPASEQPPHSTTAASISQWTEAASSTDTIAFSTPTIPPQPANGEASLIAIHGSSASGTTSSTKVEALTQDHSHASDASIIASSPSAEQHPISMTSAMTAAGSASPASQLDKVESNTTGASPSSVQSPSRGSSTQPNTAVPSTQESFFKSIHKRLLYLEANSTLSLQYIEEQSRSLRDAFVKVEKRQLAKTEKFLDHLNSTVMLELRSFRNMYDQLWQSTVIELENMKERQKSEMGEIGARLSLLADELVWQKRMAVVQSTLLLVCLGLVLFVRSGTLGSSADVPIVQHLGSKYSHFFETPPRAQQAEPGTARRRRTFRSMWRSDTSVGLSDHDHDHDHDHASDREHHALLSDAETDSARSPLATQHTASITSDTTRLAASATPHNNNQDPHLPLNPSSSSSSSSSSSHSDHRAARIQVLETQSGPATPNGTRDCRPSWEEVDRAMSELKAGAEAGAEGAGMPHERGRDRERSETAAASTPLESAHRLGSF